MPIDPPGETPHHCRQEIKEASACLEPREPSVLAVPAGAVGSTGSTGESGSLIQVKKKISDQMRRRKNDKVHHERMRAHGLGRTFPEASAPVSHQTKKKSTRRLRRDAHSPTTFDSNVALPPPASHRAKNKRTRGLRRDARSPTTIDSNVASSLLPDLSTTAPVPGDSSNNSNSNNDSEATPSDHNPVEEVSYDVIVPLATVVPGQEEETPTLTIVRAAIAEEPESIRRDRIQLGLCPDCGTQLFDVKKGILGLWRDYMPLTDTGVVHKGRCLSCHPGLAMEVDVDAHDRSEEVKGAKRKFNWQWTAGLALIVAMIIVGTALGVKLRPDPPEPTVEPHTEEPTTVPPGPITPPPQSGTPTWVLEPTVEPHTEEPTTVPPEPITPPPQSGTPTWVLLGQSIEGPDPGDLFGSYVSIAQPGGGSDFTATERLAISAPGSIFHDGLTGGLVFVYDILEDGTSQLLGEAISGSEPGNEARGVLSKDGTRLVIGEPKHTSGIGQVRVFEWKHEDSDESGLTWSWTLLGDPIVGSGGSGQSIAISRSGDTVAVGSQVRASECGSVASISRSSDTVAVGSQVRASESGSVRIYQRVENISWVQLGNDIVCKSPLERKLRRRRTDTIVNVCSWDKSGYSLSMSDDGSVVAIGSDYVMGSENRGQVRIFQYVAAADSKNDADLNDANTHSGTWTQLGATIDGKFKWTGDHFGVIAHLSSDGTTVAVSFLGVYGGSKAGVFAYDGNEQEWQQLGGNLEGDGGDDLIDEVALSGDGNRVAIASTRGNYVYVYDFTRSTGTWQQVGEKLAGENEFGDSVAISSLGTRLAVGVPGTFASPDINGSVNVYELQFIKE